MVCDADAAVTCPATIMISGNIGNFMKIMLLKFFAFLDGRKMNKQLRLFGVI